MSKWLLTILAGLVIAIGFAFSLTLSDRTGPDGVKEEDNDAAEAVPPPSAELPQTSAPPPAEPAPAPDRTGAQPTAIHETAYAYFTEFGQEKDGYGLYSYVLFPHPSPRAKAFAETLLATIGAAAESLIAPKNINILYLPTHELEAELPSSRVAGGPEALANLVVERAYNYALARALMARICSAPAEPVANLCAGDLSPGPYLFTYARPLSNLSPVPPPYLFVDLSPVHERAFSEFIAAYKAQVKRTDYTDRERIETFRLRLLSIVLTAADWVGPAGTAVVDILHMAGGQ